MLAEVCAGLLPGVPDEEVGSLLGGFVVGLGADVGVGLHGEADVGMPDPLGGRPTVVISEAAQ